MVRSALKRMAGRAGPAGVCGCAGGAAAGCCVAVEPAAGAATGEAAALAGLLSEQASSKARQGITAKAMRAFMVLRIPRALHATRITRNLIATALHPRTAPRLAHSRSRRRREIDMPARHRAAGPFFPWGFATAGDEAPRAAPPLPFLS